MRIFARITAVLLVTLLFIVLFLLGMIYMLSQGESDTAREVFVRSVKETSAIGFLADIFPMPEEAVPEAASEIGIQTNPEMVKVSAPEEKTSAEPDAWGYVDDDGDGLILVPVKGSSYSGYMLIVLDPSRVILGCEPKSIGNKGYTVQYYVEANDGVAGINGGGFPDTNGAGNGASPDTLLVSGGEVYCEYAGVGRGFVGIDSSYILHVGFQSKEDIEKWDIQEGCGFGPVLVINGEIAPEETLKSGLNPRTAIGQRSDGAILMLVIEGRQPSRLGASYLDLADVMLRFGAVNACNLDGGSSSLMWFNGEYINDSASIIGTRPIPSSFVVLKEGRQKRER